MSEEEIDHWRRNAFNYEALIVMGKVWDLGALNGIHKPTFSLTENTVAHHKYGSGDEPDQILDYIFLKSQKGSVKLKYFARVFDSPIVDNEGNTVPMRAIGLRVDQPVFLSDHFGVMARIEILR